MATFRARPEDLTGLIRERQLAVLKRALPFPVVALIVGFCLLQVDRTLCAFAFGAAAAWAYSTVQEVRVVRPALLWENAWLQEDVTVTTEEEGLRLASARGTSFMRWDGGISVLSRPDFFLIKEETDELAILPKKYLNEAELLMLNRQAAKQRA
jgi:hypothetical protein